MLRRKFAIVPALVCSVLVAGSVFAEGYWTSYIENAHPGFESRIWNDKHSDGYSTKITFRNCWPGTEGYYFRVDPTVNLRRVIAFQPDENKGSKTFNCHQTTAVGNWGEMTRAGDYRFKITHINGADWGDPGIDVEYVRVDY